MAKNLTVEPGQTKETVTRERILVEEAEKPADEVQQLPDEGIFEYIARIPQEKWDRDFIIYLYVADQNSPNGWRQIGKFKNKFDEDFVRNKWGRGNYRIILRDVTTSQRIKVERFACGDPDQAIGGVPGTAVASGVGAVPGAAGTPVEAMLSRFLESLDRRLAATDTSQIQNVAMQNALGLQKLAFESALANVRTAVAPTGDGLGGLGELLKPVIIGLVGKLLEPRDDIATFSKMFEAVKGLSGQIAPSGKSDMATEIIRTIPSLGSQIVNGLREMRLAEEARARSAGGGRVINTRAIPQPVPTPAAAPAASAPQAAPAPETAAQPAAAPNNVVPIDQAQQREQEMQKAERIIVNLVQQNASGEQVCKVLDGIDESLVSSMLPFTNEQLVMYFRSERPIMATIVDHARFLPMLDELRAYARLAEAAAKAEAGNAPPPVA
jgi:hypothetical protein